MANVKIKVSIPTFHEIVQALEASGKKLDDSSSITLEKSEAIERPIDWRCVQVRKDCMIEATKVYEPTLTKDGFALTDSIHFLNFVEDIYKYILEEKKPSLTPPITINSTSANQASNKSKW